MLRVYIFIVITISVSFTWSIDPVAEDPFFARLYSSVSKCFGEGQPSSNVNNSVDLFNRYKAECLSLVNNKTTEQDQFCLKICILNKLEIIMPDTSLSNNETSTHMSVDPESSATQLLFFYLGELQHADEISNSGEVTTCEMMAKRSDRIQARLKKCEKIKALFPKMRRCHKLTSSGREVMDELMGCVDTAIKC